MDPSAPGPATERGPHARAARRLRHVCVVAVAVLGVTGAQGALAAEPVTVGAGEDPAVTVDSAGTAFIAFNVATNSPQLLRFCKLPRGAAACSSAFDLPLTGDAATTDSGTRPYVTVSGATVRILSYRYGFSTGAFSRQLLFTSNDGGASFGPGVQVGTLSSGGGAVAGPGAGISVVNRNSSVHAYQRVPTDGSAPVTASATLSTSYLDGGSVALIDPAKPLVVLRDSTTAAFTVFTGGQPNDGVNWTAPQPIGPANVDRLAGGPSGLFVMLGAGGRLEVRRFGGTAFGSPTAIPTSESNSLSGSDLTQDDGGRLTATWNDASGNLYQSTSGDGVTWTTQKLATPLGISEERVAAAADHGGVIVYKTGSGTGATISALPIAQPAPPPPPPPAGRIGADFTYAPASPCTGVQITFSAVASAALSDDPITDYKWVFEKSREAVSTGGVPDVTEVSTGGVPSVTQVYWNNREEREQRFYDGQQYYAMTFYRDPAEVSLTVTDSRGRTSTVTKTVTFGDPKRSYDEQTLVTSNGDWFVRPTKFFDPIPLCRQQKVTAPPAALSQKPKLNGSTVSASVRCPPETTPCNGYLGVFTPIKRRVTLRATAAGNKPAGKPTVLGTKRFTIAPGQRRTVKVKLSKRSRAFIRRRHLKRLSVVVLSVNGRGASVTRTATLASGRLSGGS